MINRFLPVDSPMSNQSECSPNPDQKEPGIAVSAYIDHEIPYIRVQSIVESSKYDLGQFYA